MKNSEQNEGVKYDYGKLRYDLIAAHSLNELAKVYTMGAEKYEDNNWRKGLKWGRIFGATMRHLWAFWRGEDIDPESELPHLHHALCNLAFLSAENDNPKKYKKFDDRVDIK